MAILIQKYPKKYFGINETTNIFTGDAVPIDVTNEYFQIPSVVNIQGESWVAVNTGYVPLATQPTADFAFEICDTNGSSLQKLSLVIGTAKDPSSKPASNVVVWFNEAFVKGCYYVNSQWLGKVFHIIKGKYISTTANSNRLNEISSNYNFENNVALVTNDTIEEQLNITKKYTAVDNLFTAIRQTTTTNYGYPISPNIFEKNKISESGEYYYQGSPSSATSIKRRYTEGNNCYYEEKFIEDLPVIAKSNQNFSVGEEIDLGYSINNLKCYAQWIQVDSQDVVGELTLGTFGTNVYGVQLYKLNQSQIKYSLINPNDIIFGEYSANMIFYNFQSREVVSGFVFYTKNQ